MLPASTSTGGGGGKGDDCAASTRLPARNRSTIAEISSRLILAAAAAGSRTAGPGRDEAVGVCTTPIAGRALLTGRVSKATRLMSIRCNGPTLSEVTFPPHEPQPSVIDGGKAVENPMAPWVVGVFTVMRDAGISALNWTAASLERV